MLDRELGDAVASAAITNDGGIIKIVGAASFKGGCNANGPGIRLDGYWILVWIEGGLLGGWRAAVLVIGQ